MVRQHELEDTIAQHLHNLIVMREELWLLDKDAIAAYHKVCGTGSTFTNWMDLSRTEKDSWRAATCT